MLKYFLCIFKNTLINFRDNSHISNFYVCSRYGKNGTTFKFNDLQNGINIKMKKATC